MESPLKAKSGTTICSSSSTPGHIPAGDENINLKIFVPEVPILWPFDAKSQLIGKDPDAGRD